MVRRARAAGARRGRGAGPARDEGPPRCAHPPDGYNHQHITLIGIIVVRMSQSGSYRFLVARVIVLWLREREGRLGSVFQL